MYETSPQSKYTDYIQHIEKVIQLGIKFPTDILTGDFTSRASSSTTEDLTLKIARGYQRYIANKLKTELYNPILAQNGFDPKKVNLSVSFSTQNIIQLTPDTVMAMAEKKQISIDEFREWLGDNTGIDLFDNKIINNNMNIDSDLIPVPQKDGSVIMKPAIVKREQLKRKKLKEDFGDAVVYRLEYSHEKIDECDDYADEVYEIDSSDMPELPIHPNCKCYYEDEETGEYLGQDPGSAVFGDIPQIPESFKKEMESIHTNLQSIQDVLKTKIKSESAKEQILTEINKIQTKIESNTEEQERKRIVIETRQKEILDKIDGEINNV
jgi:hypothetical protein